MSYATDLLEPDKRYRAAKKWKKRFKKMSDGGVSLRKFCEKYGYDKSIVSRWVNLKLVPSWPSITAIEAALEKEGF